MIIFLIHSLLFWFLLFLLCIYFAYLATIYLIWIAFSLLNKRRSRRTVLNNPKPNVENLSIAKAI
jgi:hypothetical protein